MSLPKVHISVGSCKNRYFLTGRTALAFKVWWDLGPSSDTKGKPVKVEFYNGNHFHVLPSGARGGYRRSALKVRFVDAVDGPKVL